jgi:hypothetical protein
MFFQQGNQLKLVLVSWGFFTAIDGHRMDVAPEF